MKNCFFISVFFIYCYTSAFAQNWVSLQGGLNSFGRVLYSDSISNRLYVGGNFYSPDTGIIAWNGAAWDTLFKGLNYTGVTAAIRYQNQIYCSGFFFRACTKWVNGFTRWNGICWDSLNTAGFIIADISEYNNLLYCVGNFDSIGGYYSRNIIAWNGNVWIPINMPAQLTSNSIAAGVVFQNKLYLAANVYDTVNNVGYCFLTWDGNNWGLEGANSGGLISSMVVYNNELYIGGNNFFGFPCDYLVKYDGTNFSCVGNYFHGLPYKLRVIDDKLFAVGNIDTADALHVSNIATWDGNNWSAFSNDTFNNTVNDIAVFNSELYVTGGFTIINSDSINRIAKYDGWYLGEELPSKKIDDIKFYPNPVSDNLTIESSTVEKKSLSIFDILGRQVCYENFSSQKHTVNVSELAKGIYFLSLQFAKTTYNAKIIKQ